MISLNVRKKNVLAWSGKQSEVHVDWLKILSGTTPPQLFPIYDQSKQLPLGLVT